MTTMDVLWQCCTCGATLSIDHAPTRGEQLEPTALLSITSNSSDWVLSDTDAEWLQAEEDAGRLIYPVGAR